MIGTSPALLAEEQVARLATLGRWVRDDVVAVESGASLWLVDVARSRYQRLPRGEDPLRAAAFGSWSALADLAVLPDGMLLIQDATPGAPMLRTRIHPPAA